MVALVGLGLAAVGFFTVGTGLDCVAFLPLAIVDVPEILGIE